MYNVALINAYTFREHAVTPTRKSVSQLALTLLLALLASFALAKGESADRTVTWTPKLGKTAMEIVQDLETRHYHKQKLDDALSSQLFDAYLKSLDASRLFLLQSDVAAFEKYRTTLDDTLRNGDLEPGFAMFRRYQERLVQRLEKTVATLPATIAAMDFTKDESLDLERDKKPSWPQTAAEADELWRLRLKSTVLNLRLAGKKPDELVKLLEKRYRSQLARAKQYNGDDVFQIYMNALTGLYDPHTNYFSPRTSQNFNINMSLKLEGIGALLQTDDEYVKVASLVPAGPADKQGELKAADRIVGVGEGKTGEIQDVVGWRLEDVVDLIRGPKGSTVRLEVIPATAKSDAEHKIISIVRNEVILEEQSAKKSVLNLTHEGRPIKIGVINIPTFYMDFAAQQRGDANYRSTTRDVQKLLSELVAEDVSGVIIDLRENGGGSLSEANSLIGLFIESGPTVQIRYSSSRVSLEGKQRSGPYYDGPLAVMTNRLSASASEIFAGAIQDYQRGIVIGDQTFGKGTVQQLMELQSGYGELKLTQSKFYRISGDSTQHRGVLPDIPFPSLYDPKEVGESALDKALPWDRISPAQHRVYFDLQQALPNLLSKHAERVKSDPDFIFLNAQLAAAEEARKRTQLSLNEAVRKREMDEEKARNLEMENKRRIAKGEKPLAKLDEPDENDDSPLSRKKDKDKPDPMLTEAGRVLVDAIPAYQRPSFVERYKRYN